ncbi:hypothetical protein J4727_20720 [Providencia rettgeri]|uniref:Pili assembly chaperone C-terminal domain-containing protein n=1 Tax=Providencia rettgeri TaxID=587 RepID=A0A939NGK9_PRORE|nr:hypothetical protein [Providencia rettgeri]
MEGGNFIIQPYYMTIVDFNMNGKNYNDSILISPFSYYKLENTNESINVASWRFLDDNGAGTEVFRINEVSFIFIK